VHDLFESQAAATVITNLMQLSPVLIINPSLINISGLTDQRGEKASPVKLIRLISPVSPAIFKPLAHYVDFGIKAPDINQYYFHAHPNDSRYTLP
jgi:hypothetical protein